MDFSEMTKDEAYKRAKGRCECTRQHQGKTNALHHGGRCTKTFTRHGAWHAHHIIAVSSGGSNNLSNCEVLCIECHKLTETYGG